MCESLKKVVDSSQEYFKEIRGEDTSLEIRGVPKSYKKSTVMVNDGVDMLITLDEFYPEATTYLAEGKSISSSLKSTYTKMKKALTECLGDGWVTAEKDKMNDIFLKVQCPNDGEKCLIDDGKIFESMVLLGDNEQNMQ